MSEAKEELYNKPELYQVELNTDKKSQLKFNMRPEQTAAAFKMLKDRSMYQVAIDMGIAKHFDNKIAANTYVYRIFTKVKADPDKFGVLPETVLEVERALAGRSVKKNHAEGSVALDNVYDKIRNLREIDVKEIVLLGRNKAAVLMDRRMNQLLRSPKELKKEKIVDLAKVFSVYFDKGRLANGEATENIAVMSKIGDNLSPEEAMDAIMKTREKVMADREEI